ncbi:MAG: hypothetical protein MJZ90_08005 [Bacteroidales bacterium]|nr:hypothetical protein [Bacteroidales bacterium]
MSTLQAKNQDEEFTLGGSNYDGDFNPNSSKPKPPIQTPIDVDDETYSDEEKVDVNKIRVRVDDPSPLVLLFGPKGSGKTMALVRLTRYLEDQGYQLEPYRIFRPSHDKHYQKICNSYKSLCYSNYAPGGNDVINFMLVKVLDKYGRTICQILEAPGEHYFDARFPNKPFPTYIQQIIAQNMSNKRIWAFIVQKGWNPDKETNANGEDIDSEMIQTQYVQRVQQIHSTRRDRAIFICHKVDENKESTLFIGDRPNTKRFKHDIRYQYRGIFNNWKNTNPLTKWFKPEKFLFVPFSAGAFTTEESGRQQYITGDDWYPRMLWKAIIKQLKN